MIAERTDTIVTGQQWSGSTGRQLETCAHALLTAQLKRKMLVAGGWSAHTAARPSLLARIGDCRRELMLSSAWGK